MKQKMKKGNVIKIGTNLREIRKSHGYTQEKLSEAIGCSPRYISDVEQNRAKPSYEALIKICNVYNIGLDEIFSKYLKITKRKDVNYELTGFEALNEEDKQTIIHLISYFNRIKEIEED